MRHAEQMQKSTTVRMQFHEAKANHSACMHAWALQASQPTSAYDLQLRPKPYLQQQPWRTRSPACGHPHTTNRCVRDTGIIHGAKTKPGASLNMRDPICESRKKICEISGAKRPERRLRKLLEAANKTHSALSPASLHSAALENTRSRMHAST